ncbi:hypothetical protein Q6U58_003409 [Vibrio cholerae]|nr:hypothetical protein [Vibrio cholerae]
MKKSIVLMVLFLSGCASHPKIETENSPCACIYWGEQLQEPTQEQLLHIMEQLNEHRAS